VTHCQCPADDEYEHLFVAVPDVPQSASSMHSSADVWQ
jgi:hypothetical protein